jgi:hypothetical protein
MKGKGERRLTEKKKCIKWKNGRNTHIHGNIVFNYEADGRKFSQ